MKNNKVSISSQISNFSFFSFIQSRKMVMKTHFVHLETANVENPNLRITFHSNIHDTSCKVLNICLPHI